MPGWSPEIADELIRLAAADGQAFDQLQLQGLVYIAHGWCLAITDQPLTGDRPEACAIGPVYRRIADLCASYGLELIRRPIGQPGANGGTGSILDLDERQILHRVYHSYQVFSSAELAAVIRRGESPWKRIYDEGRGNFKDIPHVLIRDQFVQLAALTTENMHQSGHDSGSSSGSRAGSSR